MKKIMKISKGHVIYYSNWLLKYSKKLRFFLHVQKIHNFIPIKVKKKFENLHNFRFYFNFKKYSKNFI